MMTGLNVVAVAYAAAANVVGCCSLMLEELWTFAEQNLNLCVERSKKVPWLNGYNKQIILPNLTEEFCVHSSGT